MCRAPAQRRVGPRIAPAQTIVSAGIADYFPIIDQSLKGGAAARLPTHRGRRLID
jgi:hypothetical protein